MDLWALFVALEGLVNNLLIGVTAIICGYIIARNI